MNIQYTKTLNPQYIRKVSFGYSVSVYDRHKGICAAKDNSTSAFPQEKLGNAVELAKFVALRR